jgi:hypothetical protein
VDSLGLPHASQKARPGARCARRRVRQDGARQCCGPVSGSRSASSAACGPNTAIEDGPAHFRPRFTPLPRMDRPALGSGTALREPARPVPRPARRAIHFVLLPIKLLRAQLAAVAAVAAHVLRPCPRTSVVRVAQIPLLERVDRQATTRTRRPPRRHDRRVALPQRLVGNPVLPASLRDPHVTSPGFQRHGEKNSTVEASLAIPRLKNALALPRSRS